MSIREKLTEYKLFIIINPLELIRKKMFTFIDCEIKWIFDFIKSVRVIFSTRNI